VRCDPENRYVSTAVDKNELTQRCSTLHSQHFSTQFTSPSQDAAEVKNEGLKEL